MTISRTFALIALLTCACEQRATVLGPDDGTDGDANSTRVGGGGDTTVPPVIVVVDPPATIDPCTTIAACASGTHCAVSGTTAACVCDAMIGDTYFADSVGGSLANDALVPTGNTEPAACRFKQLGDAITAASLALPATGRLNVKATGFIDTPVVFAEAISLPARIDLSATDATPDHWVLSHTGNTTSLVTLAGDSSISGFTLRVDGGNAASTLLTLCDSGSEAVSASHLRIGGAAVGARTQNDCPTTLSDVVIADATAAGIASDGSAVTIEDSVVSGNGDGLRLESGVLTAVRTGFDDNSGDGIHVRAGALILQDGSHASGNGGAGLREDKGQVTASGTDAARITFAGNAGAGLQLGSGSAQPTSFIGTYLLVQSNQQGVVVDKADTSSVVSLSHCTISNSNAITAESANVHVIRSVACTTGCSSPFSFVLAHSLVTGGARGLLTADAIVGGVGFQEAAVSVDTTTFSGANKIGLKFRLAASSRISLTGNTIKLNGNGVAGGGDTCFANPMTAGTCIIGAHPTQFIFTNNAHLKNAANQMSIALPSGTLDLSSAGCDSVHNSFLCYTRGPQNYGVFVQTVGASPGGALNVLLDHSTFTTTTPSYVVFGTADADGAHFSNDNATLSLTGACSAPAPTIDCSAL